MIKESPQKQAKIVPEFDIQFTDSVRRYWLHDKQVIVFELKDVKRASIDEWFDTVKITYADWPPDGQKVISIHDMRKGSLTPYARARAKELVQLDRIKDMSGVTIIVVSDSFVGNLMKLFVNMVLNSSQHNMRRTVCTTIEDAYKHAQREISVIEPS